MRRGPPEHESRSTVAPLYAAEFDDRLRTVLQLTAVELEEWGKRRAAGLADYLMRSSAEAVIIAAMAAHRAAQREQRRVARGAEQTA